MQKQDIIIFAYTKRAIRSRKQFRQIESLRSRTLSVHREQYLFVDNLLLFIIIYNDINSRCRSYIIVQLIMTTVPFNDMHPVDLFSYACDFSSCFYLESSQDYESNSFPQFFEKFFWPIFFLSQFWFFFIKIFLTAFL